MLLPPVIGRFARELSVSHQIMLLYSGLMILFHGKSVDLQLSLAYGGSCVILTRLHDLMLVVIKLPFLTSSKLCSRLSKGLGNNVYGEPAWPNDILFLFPVVILGATVSIL